MKSMTCKQLQGPCDQAFSGNTPEEIMNAAMAHVMEMAAKGDTAHIKAAEMIKQGSDNPAEGEKWFAKFKADFDAQPEV